MKGSKVYSVITQTCPRCQSGPLFINKNPYKIEGWEKMHENCPNCGLHYEREPGFYQGAMYVSYALGVALSVAVVLVNLLFGFNPIIYFITNTLALIGLAPFLFRWARAIYLNIFIKYDKTLSNKGIHYTKNSDSIIHTPSR